MKCVVQSIWCFLLLASLSAANAQSEGVIDLSHSEFSEKLAGDSQAMIIDVRTAREYAIGHVPNAINIPHSDILENPQLLAEYKGRDLIFYCRSGVRAGKVTEYLNQQGFSGDRPLYHLVGDMIGWQEAGRPIEK